MIFFSFLDLKFDHSTWNVVIFNDHDPRPHLPHLPWWWLTTSVFILVALAVVDFSHVNLILCSEYTCQLFLIYRHDIFILRVPRVFVGSNNIRKCLKTLWRHSKEFSTRTRKQEGARPRVHWLSLLKWENLEKSPSFTWTFLFSHWFKILYN